MRAFFRIIDWTAVSGEALPGTAISMSARVHLLRLYTWLKKMEVSSCHLAHRKLSGSPAGAWLPMGPVSQCQPS